jgi:hypothetical protein
MFPTVLVHKKPREMSDHNPLIVSTRHSQVSHTREFRFELTWVSHPDFFLKFRSYGIHLLEISGLWIDSYID